MLSISNLKPLVNSKVLAQSTLQTVLNGLSFTSVTVQTVTTGSPSDGVNGDYHIESDALVLSTKTAGSWGAAANGNYIVLSTNETFSNKIYQVTGGSGAMSLLTAGRYIPTNSSTPVVHTISSTGTYTSTTYTNGQLLSSPSTCYCLINSTWTALN